MMTGDTDLRGAGAGMALESPRRSDALQGGKQFLDDVELMGGDALRAQWRRFYGKEPPALVSMSLLRRAVSHGLQEKQRGGLATATRRRIVRLGRELQDRGEIRVSDGLGIKQGTRLVRTWKGRVHEVQISETGFLWSGKHYSNLSEIARTITGTRWSGPRFFGLEKAAPSDKVAAQ